MRGNADTASSAAKLTTARTISLGGNLSGSASFDGTGNITIAGQVNTVRDSNNGRAIKITYSKAGQASTSYLGSWNGYELGAISPANITAGAASKLTVNGGSATQPVYFSNGKPVACTYSINKSVPANAVFTDTVYTLPAAGSTLGGVKTTSTVTSASGYTACPIIGGVPYYKDTNTTYSLSSFGVSVSATELNYTKGVTSAIQTQLNGKASSSHTHNYAGSGSVGGSANSAVKLDSSAGSSSLPVYFSNGKPVAINAAIRTFSGSLATNGWKSLGGRETWSGIMAAYNTANNTSWNSEAYSSTLVFGASDTKGMLDLGYSSPIVVFGGSNAADGSDNNPKWYFKLFGANGATYTYPSSTKTLCASDGSNASGNWGINASSASKLATARSIALTGSVTGSANFDGSGNISIATTTNHTHSQYLTSHQDISGKVNKSGDTLTGRLTKAGGGSWISDRTNVAIFGTAANKDSYNCVVGQKTPNGAWTIGNLASNDKLVFNYTTDTNYNSGSNASTAVYLPTTGGTIALTS